MKKEIYILFVFFLAIFILNYNFLDSQLENFLSTDEIVHVSRVIDGDTIVTSENEHIRLLGINTPERGEKFYEEAKRFLESQILNKNITLKFTGEKTDKYGRTLAYIFLGNENINVKMVKSGFANYYFYDGKDRYSDDLENVWNKCLENNINLCEPSEDACSFCVKIIEKEIVNGCNFTCDISDWEIKVEGRNKFVFSGILNPTEKADFDLNLDNSGGSLFLRDENGGLVGWEKEP